MSVMNKRQIIEYLSAPDAAALFARADAVRQQCCGDEIYLRGIIEVSNDCRRDCCYCGLRRSNTALPRYRLTPEEIVAAAELAARLGYGSVVIQSGESSGYECAQMCRIIRAIKEKTGLAVTLSLGECAADEYRQFRESGADRYLLKIETTNRQLFRALKPDSSWENRRRCLEELRCLGYQLGSGIMVGLPGQTLADIAADLLQLQAWELDMIGIGPFIPHPDTPLAGAAPGSAELAVRAVALMRILCPYAHLPATTALGSIDPQGRQKALCAGANVLMPNVTPQSYRSLYAIYPHKVCIDETTDACAGYTHALSASLGRRISNGPGHSLRPAR
ncbi:MAG: [FeFe] hydrogenase H-cluster radical SAM maturase HydE [Candidatus Omnitrophica bacterium]|nr:[FeFe] hydrogenase H-cluster radical SAM maturase HydE [Candidatus Omnitrophota bacterium]